jgi:hypothetical protein
MAIAHMTLWVRWAKKLTDDDGCQVMTIPQMTLWVRWPKKLSSFDSFFSNYEFLLENMKPEALKSLYRSPGYKPSLAESIYIRSSIKILHFVPFRQQIWMSKGNSCVWLANAGLDIKHEKVNRRTTDAKVMTIPHMTLWVRWPKKLSSFDSFFLIMNFYLKIWNQIQDGCHHRS